MAGVVVFGREPRVEVPPAPSRAQPAGHRDHDRPREHRPGRGVKLALASFPEDTARRIVVLSDGNENRGNLLEQALAAKSLGVQADVLPIEYFYDREVLVEKVSIPPDVKKGETGQHQRRASAPASRRAGRSRSSRRPITTGPRPLATSSRVPVELQRGINVFTLKQLITEPNFYTFSAEFIPEKGSGDRRAINNRAEGFTARTRQGPGPADRGDRRRARRAGQGPAGEGDRGQGVDRPPDRRLAGASAATRCRPTWPSSSRMTP